MSLSFLLLVLAVVLLALVHVTALGTATAWVALGLAVVAAVVAATKNDRVVGR